MLGLICLSIHDTGDACTGGYWCNLYHCEWLPCVGNAKVVASSLPGSDGTLSSVFLSYFPPLPPWFVVSSPQYPP